MRVLVVIPSPTGILFEDRSALLKRAVDSVNAQTMQPVEMVVEEDEAGFASENRNLGVANAKKAFDAIAFLDDDDWWYPTYLEEALALLPGYDVVITNSDKSRKRVYFDDTLIRTALLNTEGITPTSGLIITKEAFKSIGGFREDLQTSETFDLCLRLSLSGKKFIHNTKPLWFRELGLPTHLGQLNSTVEGTLLRRSLIKKCLP